jgi:hypothetical protein
VLPPPGNDLRLLISERRRNGRSAWRLGPNIAPRIELVAVRDPETGNAMLHRPPAVDQDRRPYFHPRVLLWLETQEPLALEQLKKHDRVETRRLAAAVMCDLHARSFGDIAYELAYPDESRARERVKEGRKLWPRLCAWPWSYWEPDGRPPDDWRERGADATLTAAFETWATGAPVLPVGDSGFASCSPVVRQSNRK